MLHIKLLVLYGIILLTFFTGTGSVLRWGCVNIVVFSFGSLPSICSLLICSSLKYFVKHLFYTFIRQFQCIQNFLGLILFMAVFMICFFLSHIFIMSSFFLKFCLWQILWGKFLQKGFILDSVRYLGIQNILNQNLIFNFLVDHGSSMTLGLKPMRKPTHSDKLLWETCFFPFNQWQTLRQVVFLIFFHEWSWCRFISNLPLCWE